MRKIWTKSEYQEVCETRGYKFLSVARIKHSTYSQTCVDLICPNNHLWNVLWNDFYRGGNCGICKIERGATPANINNYLVKYKYELISEFDQKSIIVACKNGHQKTINPYKLINLKGICWDCIYENNQFRLSNILSEKAGILIKPFLKGNDSVNIKCSNNHEWDAKLCNILKGHWCKECKLNERFNDIVNFLNELNFTIDENIYKNSKNILIPTYCKRNHSVLILKSSIFKHKGHCAECLKEENNEKLEKIMTEKGGKLLKRWISSNKNIKIKCLFDHEWSPNLYAILNGSWCPHCSGYKSEEICRIAFETIFNNKFPKYKSDDMRGVRGGLLEIDGYCQELGIAFEHNGDQHYKEDAYFPSPHIFANDKLKLAYCNNHAIKLIIIPQLSKYIKLENLISFILDKLLSDFNIYIDFDRNYKLDLSSIYKQDKYMEKLKECQDYAISKEGACLSKSYTGSSHKMEWMCKNNHKLQGTYHSYVYDKQWCLICSYAERTIKIDISKEKLIDLYVNQKLSINKISKLYNTYNNRISKLIKEYGIIKKDKCEYDILYDLFVVQQKSSTEIAVILGENYNHVRNMIAKYKITK